MNWFEFGAATMMTDDDEFGGDATCYLIDEVFGGHDDSSGSGSTNKSQGSTQQVRPRKVRESRRVRTYQETMPSYVEPNLPEKAEEEHVQDFDDLVDEYYERRYGGGNV